ncbi:hypothetical protein M408DRAFT_27823 [Serendipita vermifera MAFF 305830]|uniref:Uncharacterized protein n=1 Tax=Serendipita vermifera MAFF 305830 TaxID=933852 RepID=A0A0C2X1Y8_SERVB|nr:hypothetical protein M408DRAFT_27823 [Serendipita vermifera MAFF 305830]
MNNSSISAKYRDPDLVVTRLDQRTKILTRLIDNKNVPSIKPKNNPTIHYLQQEYNHVTDQIAQLEHQPLLDPMKVLPLELCADIIKEIIDDDSPVNILLDLTTVSMCWCNILMSLPSLWTIVVFDSAKDDYLAKAAVGLSLSGTCDLSVRLTIPVEQWPEFSPIILPESGRVVSLQMQGPHLNTSDSEKILHNFGGLSVLKILELPTEYNSDHFDSRSMNVDFEKMPLLGQIIGPRPEPLEYSCSRFLRMRIITIPTITQDMVNVWAKLPNLIDLTIFERGNLPDYSPETLNLSLLSVKRFWYYGGRSERALNLLGPNLTSITVQLFDFREVLGILARFPQMHTLALIVLGPFDHGETVTGPSPSAHSSLKVLKIRGNSYDHTNTTELHEAISSWAPVYQALIDILPCVGILVLEYGVFVDETWSYISSLNQLHELTVSNCSFHLSNSQSLVTMENLSSVRWSVLPDSVVVFSKIMAPNLRSLHMDATAAEWMSMDADAANHSISETAFPNLASLNMFIAKYLLWNIGVYKNLREMVLYTPFPYMDVSDLMVRSDILEAVLIRPSDFPALERIELPDLPFECDILLLMLERKNIYAQPGISPIKTLVLKNPPSYHLLYPIATLLRGKFPDREPNVAFSLDAVRHRIFSESS